MALTATIRIRDDDYRWLMQNRGAGSVADKIHELVEKEKDRGKS